MATQLSLGAIAAAIGARIQAFFEGRVAAVKAWRGERRREQQRREVIRKHVEKGTQPEVIAKAEARQKKAAASAVAANAKAGAAAADAGEGAVTGGRVPAIAAKAEALLRRSRPAPTPAPPDDDDDETDAGRRCRACRRDGRGGGCWRAIETSAEHQGAVAAAARSRTDGEGAGRAPQG